MPLYLPSTALGGIAEASQSRAPRAPECSTAWYRRSVPSRSTTKAHSHAGWVGGRDFPGLTANPNTHLVPPGVCGSRPLLAVWDPRFSRAHHQPQHTFGPSWSVRHLAAPRSVGPAVFLGSPPTHSHKSALTHRERHSSLNVLSQNANTTTVNAETDTRQTTSQHHTDKPRTSTASSSSHAEKPLRGFSLHGVSLRAV